MNKKTKLLLVLLSSTALTAGAFGLAACSGEAHNEEYYAQYQQYVSATAEGEVLSYEDWLIGILEDAKGEKGEKGDKGDTGEAGKAGTQWTVGESDPAATSGADGDFYLNKTTFDVYNKVNGTWTKIGSIKGSDGAAGATGNGIDTIVYKDGALEVTLTSGSKINVALPEEMTHVHTYGSELTTLIEPTVDKEGLAYKTCTDADCGHIELVVLPKLQYEITVTYEGTPLANVEVTVSGEGISAEGSVTATTDENGKVSVSPEKAGEYTISVAGYTVIEGGKTSATQVTYAISVVKNLVSDETVGAGTYAVAIDPSGTGDSRFVLETDDAVKYTLSVDGKAILNSAEYNDGWMDWEYSELTLNNDGKYEAVVLSGAPQTYALSVDWDAIGEDYAPYTVLLTVEEGEAPAEGDKLRPINVNLEDEFTVKGNSEWTYYTLTVNDNVGKITDVKFTYEGTASVEFTQKKGGVQDAGEYALPVTSGTSFKLNVDGGASYGTSVYKFRVKTSGDITINTEIIVPVGSEDNPAVAQKGENSVEDLGMGKQYYYKLEVPANSDYVFDITEGMLSIRSGSVNGTFVGSAEEGAKIGLKVTEAGTYYIICESLSTQNVKFTVRDYNEGTDLGLVKTHPIEITKWTTSEGNRSYTYTNAELEAATTVYFKMSVPVVGRFVVVSNSEDVTYSCLQSGTIYESEQIGTEINIQVVSYDTDAGYDFNLEWHEMSEETSFNVQLKDTAGEVIVGAIITATPIGGGEAVVSAATNEEGKTTLVLNPMYNYTFTVDFAEGDATKYSDGYSWTLNTDSGKYDFGGDIVIDTVEKLVEHTVTIYEPDGTTPVVGATVKLLLGGTNGKEVGTAVTDETGKAVFNAPKLAAGSMFSGYTVMVEYPAEYPGYSAGNATIPVGQTTATIISSVVHEVGEDMKLIVGTNKVTVENPYGGQTVFTFTAEKAGTYNISLSDVQSSFWTYWYVNGEQINRYTSMSYSIEATAGQEITVGLMSVSGAIITIANA